MKKLEMEKLDLEKPQVEKPMVKMEEKAKIPYQDVVLFIANSKQKVNGIANINAVHTLPSPVSNTSSNSLNNSEHSLSHDQRELDTKLRMSMFKAMKDHVPVPLRNTKKSSSMNEKKHKRHRSKSEYGTPSSLRDEQHTSTTGLVARASNMPIARQPNPALTLNRKRCGTKEDAQATNFCDLSEL